MIYLIAVSFVWAFSFGLIKQNLTGIDPNFVAFVRVLISFIIFAVFIRIKHINPKLVVQFLLIGMIQYGVMYMAYIYSYQFLKAHEVALFTIFTPLYVTLINDIQHKRIHRLFFVSALLATGGTAVILYQNTDILGNLSTGFLIIQISNICFAFGQVSYKKVMNQNPHINDRHIFGLLYLGALFVTALSSGVTTDWVNIQLNLRQILTLLYLGVLASGICFFLWNYGAKKTNIGTLSICNNLKIPLAVTCSIVIFSEVANIPKLLLGGGILLSALFFNERIVRKSNKKKN